MKIRFVHVGLMKTATSYLQTIWRNDPGYRLIHQDANRMVNYIRESTPKGSFDPEEKFSLKLDPQPNNSGELVVSSEGFTCAFMNDENCLYIYNYIDNSSALLSKISHLTDTVVITVRNPVKWLSSMHAQFVNQGGFGSFMEFYRSRPYFLPSCLDLEFMVECYRRYFSNVVVVPCEYLDFEGSFFWNYMKEKTGAPLPTVKAPRVNESVSEARLVVMSEINNINYIMREALKKSEIYKNKECDQLVSHSEAKDKWFSRRFCQFSTDEDFFEVYGKLGDKTDIEEFTKISLPSKDAHQIEKRFIDVVAEMTGDDSLAQSYLKDLKQVVEDS